MKKILFIAALALFCLGGTLFAQQQNADNQQNAAGDNGQGGASGQNAPKYKESDYYYFNVPIEKIYYYREGYIVLYRKGVNQTARTYLPANWFSDIGGLGEIIYLGSGSEWPSMSVYYKSGTFSHVRLRVRRARAHETWGVVPLSVNIDEYFEGVEEVKLEF